MREGGSFLFVLIALLLTLGSPSSAQAPSTPHVTLIVCPGLTYRGFMDGPYRGLTNSMAIALLSPGNARKPDPVANLYATLYAGDTANTKNPNKDLLMRVITDASPPGRVTVVPQADPDEAFSDAQSAIEGGDRVIVCGLPPVDPRTGQWNRLSVVLVNAPQGWGNASLTSSTTQTPGLVALRDIAPSVLSYAGIPIPDSMAGHVIQRTSRAYPDLSGMDSLAHLNQVILLPTMWTYGLISFVAVMSSLWSLSLGIYWKPGLQRFLLRMMMGSPLAFMLAAIPDPVSAWTYGLSIIAAGLLLGVIPRVGFLLTLTALLVGVDGLTGAHALSRSSLSGYWISGIRFYGIGNEYMGILIGSALVTAYIAARRWPEGIRSAKGSAPLGLWLGFLLFVLSYPAFGAKAGGAVTAMVAFVPAWLALTKGRRVDWRICAASAVAGFALVFVWAALASLTGARTTHIQTVASHAAHGDSAYIWHIALRKAKLAIATATVPGVLATYVGFIPMWLLWRKTPLKEHVREFLAANPAFGAVMRAGIAASAAALLFNDSGFVAFVLLFGALSLTLMHEMLGSVTPAVSSPLTALSRE